MLDQSVGMRPFDLFKVIVKNVDIERPTINAEFKLKEGEAPLEITIGKVSDSGDVILESNKELQVVDLAVFSGRTEAFEFSIIPKNPQNRMLQLMNAGQQSYRDFQEPENKTESELTEEEKKQGKGMRMSTARNIIRSYQNATPAQFYTFYILPSLPESLQSKMTDALSRIPE